MNALAFYIWSWLIGFIICLWWLKCNDDWVNDYYAKGFSEFTFDFYQKLLYLVVFIIAPVLAIVIVFSTLKGWIFIGAYKMYLRIILMRLKDKDVKKDFRKLIKEVKL